MKALLISICMLLAGSVSAQVNLSYSAKKKANELKRSAELNAFLSDPGYCQTGPARNSNLYYNRESQYLSNYSMTRLIRQDLTKITLDQEGMPSIGNYASLKYSENDTRITLNASFMNPFRKPKETDPLRWILSTTVKAGVSDGIASLFANENASNKTGLQVKASFLSKKTNYVNEDFVNCNTLNLYRTYLKDKFDYSKEVYDSTLSAGRKVQTDKITKALKKQVELSALINGPRVRQMQDSLDLALLKDSITYIDALKANVLNTRLNAQDASRLRDLTEKRLTNEFTLRLANVAKEKAKVAALPSVWHDQIIAEDYSIKTIGLALAKFEADKPVYDVTETINSIYKELYQIETKDVRWDYFKLRWFDLIAGISGDKYKLYNKSAIIPEPLSERPFTTWSLGFALNSFNSGRLTGLTRNGYFVKFTVVTGNSNNLVGVTPDEIIYTTEATENNTKRQSISKSSAYKSPFISSHAHNFSAHFSKYLNDNQSLSWNLYSIATVGYEKILKLSEDPNLLAGTGVTFSLLNKEKEKSYLNFELFLNFNDLLNSKEKETLFYQRHQIGLKVGVPFNSIFINNPKHSLL